MRNMKMVMTHSTKAQPEFRQLRDSGHACGYGFTLVEIVIVILILAIISAVFMARLGGANTFNGLVVRDQIIALTRIAQQSSFGRSGVTMTFTPNPAGDEATIVAEETNGVIEQVIVPITSLSLAGDIDETDSCGSTFGGDAINSSNPLTITFGALGTIVASSGVGTSAGAVNTALRFCVNNDPALSVCFAPSGFAYIGDCDVD